MAQSAEPLLPSPVVLTNASQIRDLTSAQAASAIPLRLTGVMIDTAYPSQQAIILADQTAGIYVRTAGNKNLFATYHRGDLVELQGVTDPGQFAPIVIANEARKLGTGTIPAAQPVTYQQLISGALDAQWVEIQGVVRQCYQSDATSQIVRITVEANGGLIPVRFNILPGAPIQVDSEVCVQAVCLYQFNQKRQVLNPILEVPKGVPVRIVKPAPADPYAAPLHPATSLLVFSPENLHAYAHRVHVHGVVTCSQPGSFVWIRDGHTGLRIQTDEQKDLLPGDNIDVLGFPKFGSYSPVLEDSVFRKTGGGLPPVPFGLTNFNEAFDHEDDLVAMEGKLTQIQPILDGVAFTLEKDGNPFKAVLRMPRNQQTHADWQVDSIVNITGICTLTHEDTRPLEGIWLPKSFQILLRSPADLSIIKPPPWLTPRHATMLLGFATGTLALMIGIVVTFSRRRLREQKHQREMAEAEFAAILSERNRLAREIHDTLAQGLTATSVQLRLARKHATGVSEAISRHLNTALQLVRESLEEARNSIWNMRAHVLETGDLASALKGILKQMADGTEIATSIEVAGRSRRLAPVIENNTLRIGQEAISNALKHARASQVKVTLEFGESQFCLRVQDDGRGFDPNAPPPSDGGFGLVGMRERATELKGELNIRSVSGQGSEVILSIPLSGD